MSSEPNKTWAEEWLSVVLDSKSTMSQRKLATIDAEPGRLQATIAVAKAKGLHLTVFTDDTNTELLVASIHPVRVLC